MILKQLGVVLSRKIIKTIMFLVLFKTVKNLLVCFLLRIVKLLMMFFFLNRKGWSFNLILQTVRGVYFACLLKQTIIFPVFFLVFCCCFFLVIGASICTLWEIRGLSFNYFGISQFLYHGLWMFVRITLKGIVISKCCAFTHQAYFLGSLLVLFLSTEERVSKWMEKGHKMCSIYM